jgi:hypothetical protein
MHRARRRINILRRVHPPGRSAITTSGPWSGLTFSDLSLQTGNGCGTTGFLDPEGAWRNGAMAFI